MPNFKHICQDEKFINSGFYQFEELYPNKNRIIIYNCPKKEVTHIKIPVNKIDFLDENKNINQLISDNDILIFHSLPNNIIDLFTYISHKNRIVWLLFGYETYGDKKLYNDKILFDKLTYKKYVKPPIKHILKSNIKKILSAIGVKRFKIYGKNEKIRLEKKLNVYRRVDFFGFAFREEYEAQCSMIGIKKPFFNFGYYPLEKIVDTNQQINLDKTTIMIGHSGFKNGNHIDIIKKINRFNLKQASLILPCSYGDKDYINQLKNENYIKNNRYKIKFIDNFLPLDQYNNLLKTVKVAIFNNRRQQAIGNIIALLYFGSKVFISENNTFFQYLKRNNVIIYSYEKDLNQQSVENGLNSIQIESNRIKLHQLFNATRLKEDLYQSIKEIITYE